MPSFHPGLLLMVLLVAGCMEAPAGTLVVEGEPPTMVLSSCELHEAAVPVEPNWAQGLLPEGFAPVELAPLGQAVLVFIAEDCGGVTQTWTVMPVAPPVHLRAEDVDEHVAMFSIVTADANVRTTLTAWGFDAVLVEGDTILEALVDEAFTRSGRATATTEAGSLSILTQVHGEPREPQASRLRFFMVKERQLLGAMDGDLSGKERVYDGEAIYESLDWPFLPEERGAGLAFHQFADRQEMAVVPSSIP